ncbi:MAG: thiol peroxidase [Myxococcota bacterium]
MATTALKGNPIHTNGDLPAVGDDAPDFVLVGTDMADKSLADFAGKKKILSINPSYDTPVCQVATRTFNQRAAGLDDVVVLMVSADLPFAQKRFCAAEGIEGVVPVSTFRGSFMNDYGVELIDGPLKGVSARAIVVIDENDKVVHTEMVPEIAQEPDYDAALAAVS